MMIYLCRTIPAGRWEDKMESILFSNRCSSKPSWIRAAAIVVTVVWLNIGLLAEENRRSGLSVNFHHGDLKVSLNKRFIVHADGTAFFYLGDTAWELFHRLNRKEAERYLENRRQKGFTVIQAVALGELDGLGTPNANGDRPFINNDPKKPNEAYFKHMDYIVETARKKGIYIGMLPTWGDKVTKAWGQGPVVFTPRNLKDVESYGRFLGQRYKNKPNIIWILGGDRAADGVESVWRAMARGIKQGDGGRHLMTYHPQGGRSSAEWFHNDSWLDFNMLQSGHGRFDNDNYNKITKDYNRRPTKPCLDGEPRYEDHPVKWNAKNGWFNDFDVRQAAYWALFAGAFGHTYGCHDIWQMYAPGRKPISSARNYWYDVLDLPGAWDMMHVRNLMQSRPFLERVPDQSLISGDPGKGGGHIQATRGKDYAFVYLPYGQNVKVRMGKISGQKVKAWWFDPRTGQAKAIGTFAGKGAREFDPPGKKNRGNDWVLVLDDASKGFAPPGSTGMGNNPAKTKLGIKGSKFTINGKKIFLFGISYYGALGAPQGFITRDLDDMRKLNINWIRVWATWAAFDNNIMAVDDKGQPREPYFSNLKWLVAECGRRGMIVDVTLSRGNGIVGPIRLQSLQRHHQAVQTIVSALKPYQNWYLDLANERNIKDKRFVSFDELRQLRETAKQLDPDRLITASHAGDVSREDLQKYLKNVRVDFISPHRPRNPTSSGQTEAKSRQYLMWMKEIGRVVPLHYQEPFRRGFTRGWEPLSEDYISDAGGALKGGAAGWCLHNGDQKNNPKSEPRRSFDMRNKRLFDQLDNEEKKALQAISELLSSPISSG